VPTKVRFDAFELDASSGELRKSGILLKLQPQPSRVLLLLIEHAGQLVTREEIQRYLWTDSTFVDFDHGINFCINQIRVALADNAEEPRYVETLPRRGYRFIATVVRGDGASVQEMAVTPAPKLGISEASADDLRSASGSSISSQYRVRLQAALFGGRIARWAIATIAFVLVMAALGYRYFRRTPPLTMKDTVVLADFSNSTGDPIFDDALRQALSIQLAQSPFLDILSDRKVGETLRLMGRSPGGRVTSDVAQEICERTGSKAVLDGSISRLGSQYLLSVNAINCSTGDSLARGQAQAEKKEEILSALGGLSTNLRLKLGESFSMVEKFDTPLVQATTPSLDALKALTLGRKALVGGDFTASLSAFQRAIALDPNFALAYAALSESYANLGEEGLASENAKKAYELRDRVTEMERFILESNYYSIVTGDLGKARQTYELMSRTYPRNSYSHFNLGNLYTNLGEYEKGLAEAQKSFSMSRAESIDYAYLAFAYITVGRLKEARATVEEALAKNLDSPSLRMTIYPLAFLQDDRAGMAEQVAWSTGKPGVEDALLAMEASTAAYSGQNNKARELSRQAVASAERAEEKETAAGYEADAALREALFGNIDQARQRVRAALNLSTNRDVQFVVALTLALTGRAAQAQKLTDELARRFPEDTIVRFNYLPTVRSQVALNAKDTSKAIEALQAAVPYELGGQGDGALSISMYPVYVRGQAYLAAHRGNDAAVEFQKILDHRGIVLNEVIGPLAHLGRARAYALQGDMPKALAAYHDFFALWKDADPDLPIFKKAKSEYDTKSK
jgi:DNA-binding winged helix-turn-helix (wHTH) protein/tetratricopeptide (TPR) repeat protein